MMIMCSYGSSSGEPHFNLLIPCSQIILMGTPILREDNVLRSSNVATFQGHPCAQEPCHNGGQCSPQLNTYECVCLSGFSGGHCQSSESPFFSVLNISYKVFCIIHKNLLLYSRHGRGRKLPSV